MKYFVITIVAVLFAGCASPKLVSSWKSPDADSYAVYKVLVVGMTQDEEVRTVFETRLRDALRAKGFEAERSMELFDKEFTTSQKTEADLNEVEQRLLAEGFDAILLTKVIGSENRETFRRRIGNIDNLYNQFSNDYLDNQSVYYDTNYYDTFKIYTAETSLYCICLERERALVWRGNINVAEPVKLEKTIDSYIKVIEDAMQKEAILF
ncbi:hypothetical protein ACOKFD_16480 [Flagellimonas sp. S174]|uniref:hypothetical protein n=1 Tax=Flagellimonas sp. S174 TaxID=3410790 RepID=UPI003BF4AD6B